MMKKLQKIKQRYTLVSMLVIVAILGTVSCKQNQSSGTDESHEVAAPAAQQPEPVKAMAYQLSTPIEITKMLNEAGAAYIPTTTNPVENIDKYEIQKAKALNLGVYSADLSYASTYNQTQEINSFFLNVKKLTESLGITEVFTEAEVKRFENNIENKDSLYAIISGEMEITYEKLNNNGMGEISALTLAGGWVEGVYLATKLAETAQNMEVLNAGILQQYATLKQLIATLELYKESENIAEVISSLNEIAAAFEAIGDEMSDEELVGLSEKVEAYRKSIIN